jgi:hypothetical protein
MRFTTLANAARTFTLMSLLSVTIGTSMQQSAQAQTRNQASTQVSQLKSTKSWETVYADGRTSQVRTFQYFDHYLDKSPSAAKRPLKLMIVAVEWGNYDAVVGDYKAAFAQVASDRMAGGSEEANRLVCLPSRAFFANARTALGQQKASLTRIGKTVPNRNIDMVSFDFITNKGTFTIQQDRRSLENETSPWSNMFREARALKEKISRVEAGGEFGGIDFTPQQRAASARFVDESDTKNRRIFEAARRNNARGELTPQQQAEADRNLRKIKAQTLDMLTPEQQKVYQENLRTICPQGKDYGIIN